MLKEVSLIIPCQNAENKLFKLLERIPSWEAIPNEIIIVDSSLVKLSISEDFILFAKKFNIHLSIINKKNLYPGHARNIGIINAKNSLMAFLDTSTIPSNTWLSSGLKKIYEGNYEGVWGKTHYQAQTYIAKIIRASTYGTKPIKTFPGSIIKKSVFNKCGLFIETARAGEDGDWIARAELHGINISYPNPKEFLNYDELNHTNIRNVLKKWFRNYTLGSRLPHSRVHKDIYFYIFSFIAVVIAYNWNRVFASWQEDSIFFIPYVTRLSILGIIILYIAIRGVLLPSKKGVSLKFIFPLNFLVISFLSALIDLIKGLSFAYSRFIKK